MTTGTGHGEKQSRLREQAIAALLETSTITAAANRIGVDESTLRAWLKAPDFAEEYLDARRAVMAQATDRLADACTDAVASLVDVTKNSESDGARVSASKAVLDYAYKAVELEDLSDRMGRLEKELENDKERGHDNR